MPATAAFWTSSKLARPRDQQHPVVQGQLAGEEAAPDQLVECVVPADVLAHRDERPVGGEQARRVEAAGGTEDGLALAEARG